MNNYLKNKKILVLVLSISLKTYLSLNYWLKWIQLLIKFAEKSNNKCIYGINDKSNDIL